MYISVDGVPTSGNAATLLAAAAISAMPFCAITTSCKRQQFTQPKENQGDTGSQVSSSAYIKQRPQIFEGHAGMHWTELWCEDHALDMFCVLRATK